MEIKAVKIKNEVITQIPKEIGKEQLKELAPSAFVSKPHPKMGNSYRFVNTEDIIDKLIEDGFKPFNASQLNYRKGGNLNESYQFHEVSFYHPNLVVLNDDDKSIEEIFEVIITNSHNGYSKFRLYCSFYGLKNNNDMLCISDDLGGIINKNMVQIKDIDPNTLFNEITNHFLDMVKCIKKMKDTTLTKVQQIDVAAKMAIIRHLKQDGKFNYDAKDLLIPQTDEKTKRDLWSTYNVVIEKLINGFDFSKSTEEKQAKINNHKDIVHAGFTFKVPRKIRAVNHFEMMMQLNKDIFETVKSR
jgi:hypothetical protein